MNTEAQPIRILFVEDLPTDVELAKREIKKEKIHFTSIVVDTEDEFRKELSDFDPDIVISDYSMPAFDGMSALRITRSFPRNILFIVFTGSMNEETAVACMKAGANDYVIKEQDEFQIMHGTTGKEAVELCRMHPDIDIILMDVKMPVKDGYQATRIIREFNKEVIIIAQTAYALAGDKEQAMKAGCNGYIPKPFKREKLFDMINHFAGN